MHPNYTPSEFQALHNKPTTADYEPVRTDLAQLTSAPLSWDSPGDDAEFLTELIIGEKGKPGLVVLIFSKFGDLCLPYVPLEPIIGRGIVEEVLSRHGWVAVTEEAANLVLYPSTGAKVGDCFFSYT